MDLIVLGIPYSTTSEELAQYFEQFGAVNTVEVTYPSLFHVMFFSLDHLTIFGVVYFRSKQIQSQGNQKGSDSCGSESIPPKSEPCLRGITLAVAGAISISPNPNTTHP